MAQSMSSSSTPPIHDSYPGRTPQSFLSTPRVTRSIRAREAYPTWHKRVCVRCSLDLGKLACPRIASLLTRPSGSLGLSPTSTTLSLVRYPGSPPELERECRLEFYPGARGTYSLRLVWAHPASRFPYVTLNILVHSSLHLLTHSFVYPWIFHATNSSLHYDQSFKPGLETLTPRIDVYAEIEDTGAKQAAFKLE